MSKTKRVIVYTLCCVLAVLAKGCIPDPLEVSGIPVVPKQIVVTTQMVPDRSLIVLLTRTFGALEASEDSDPQEVLDQIAVTDAVVTLAGPSGIVTLPALGSGFYGGIDTPFQVGERYTLHVKSESLGEVSATTAVMPAIPFRAVEASTYYDNYGDGLAQVSYSFTDPQESNWYMLNVQRLERGELVDRILNPQAYTRLLEDSEFNGQPYAETVRVFQGDYEYGDTVVVSLSHISEDYYSFMKLRLDNRFSFVEYLSEPVNYPSNVEGGKGFFNLYVPDVRVLVLN